MGAPTLQSLTIPSHTTRTTPSPPHVVYHLTIRTSHSTYTLTPRYSSFAALHASLTTELGSSPPGTFPPKHPYRILNPFARGLSDTEATERRLALETWLRGLVMDRDRRWVNSRSLREFLAAPDGLGEEGADGGRWTSSSWLTAQGELAVLSRTIRASFAKRDALVMRGETAAAYGVEKDGKTGLVELVTRLGALTKGLAELARGGMVEGEITRRKEMIQRLQDDIEGLGVAAGSKARAPIGAAKHEVHEPEGGRRGALLGSAAKPTGRVLGAAAKAKETAETRALDNGGLLQLQDEYVSQQDSKLEGLAAALRRQKDLGLMIADELAVQDEIISGLEGDVDRVGGGGDGGVWVNHRAAEMDGRRGLIASDSEENLDERVRSGVSGRGVGEVGLVNRNLRFDIVRAVRWRDEKKEDSVHEVLQATCSGQGRRTHLVRAEDKGNTRRPVRELRGPRLL